MITQAEYCDHCGARIKAYWHRLNKPLVAALIKCYIKNKLNPFKLSEQGLSQSQFCNFQKLKYFGLVYSIEKENGHWALTEKAEQFIWGKIQVDTRVQTFRGDVRQLDSTKTWIWKIVEGYEYRSDYAK